MHFQRELVMSAGALAFLYYILYRLLELVVVRKLSQDVTPAYELPPYRAVERVATA